MLTSATAYTLTQLLCKAATAFIRMNINTRKKHKRIFTTFLRIYERFMYNFSLSHLPLPHFFVFIFYFCYYAPYLPSSVEYFGQQLKWQQKQHENLCIFIFTLVRFLSPLSSASKFHTNFFLLLCYVSSGLCFTAAKCQNATCSRQQAAAAALQPAFPIQLRSAYFSVYVCVYVCLCGYITTELSADDAPHFLVFTSSFIPHSSCHCHW